MKPNELYLRQPKNFWAYVRSISQRLGYTVTGKANPLCGRIKVPSLDQIVSALISLQLDSTQVRKDDGSATALGQ